jgi:predicted RNA-binding protein with PIN domain
VPLARFDLLIDGYNLMHAAGFARERYAPGQLEQERERFLGWLWRRIPPPLRNRTVVVFDGGGSDNEYLGQASFREMRLLYSPRGCEADDIIEELIAEHSSPRQLQVISSDHRLHRAARRRKAASLDSEVFLAGLARLARQARERQRELEELSKSTGELPAETREWLAVFAEADQWLAEARRETAVEAPVSPTGTASGAPAAASLPASPPSDPSQSPPAATVDADELAFWEARLAELFSPPLERS